MATLFITPEMSPSVSSVSVTLAQARKVFCAAQKEHGDLCKVVVDSMMSGLPSQPGSLWHGLQVRVGALPAEYAEGLSQVRTGEEWDSHMCYFADTGEVSMIVGTDCCVDVATGEVIVSAEALDCIREAVRTIDDAIVYMQLAVRGARGKRGEVRDPAQPDGEISDTLHALAAATETARRETERALRLRHCLGWVPGWVGSAKQGDVWAQHASSECSQVSDLSRYSDAPGALRQLHATRQDAEGWIAELERRIAEPATAVTSSADLARLHMVREDALGWLACLDQQITALETKLEQVSQ